MVASENMRRRKGSPKIDKDELMIDRDDQEKLIAKLENDAAAQQLQVQRYFRGVCACSSLVTIAVGFVIDRRVSNTLREVRWVHILLSSAMFWFCRDIYATSSLRKVLMILSIVMAAVVSMLTRRQMDAIGESWEEILLLHQCVGAVNLIVCAVRLLLQHDEESTEKALRELRSSTYQFKSL